MNDEDKANLARQGVKAVNLLDADKVREGLKGRASEVAGGAALRGIAALGRLTGNPRSEARVRAHDAVELGDALESWNREDAAEFEKKLHEAAAKTALKREESKQKSLAALRRSFPEASREFALLIFNCVDLLEDLSDDAEGAPESPAKLEKKEQLLTRMAELLAPGADVALRSFVEHVAGISRRHRGESS